MRKPQVAWKSSDETYLIANYYVAGPQQVSEALGRGIRSVMARANELRKAGRLTGSSYRGRPLKASPSPERSAT